MTAGYVLTHEGSDALEMFMHERVRFAASLDDGRGLIAFDGAPLGLENLGKLWMAQPPDGADPSQPLPDWYKKAAPKRAIGTGMEHYALVVSTHGDNMERYLHTQDSVSGIVRVSPNRILVETWHGPVAAGTWSASVVEYRDKRLELVSA